MNFCSQIRKVFLGVLEGGCIYVKKLFNFVFDKHSRKIL